MDAIPRSPFDTLETCFRLLSTGPACLALDGRRLGHGLPARRIPRGELRVLLQHPAATSELGAQPSRSWFIWPPNSVVGGRSVWPGCCCLGCAGSSLQ